MSLPSLVLLEQYSGNWERYLDAVYSQFMSSFVNAGLLFNGLPVRCAWSPPTDNKHFGFWHVISERPENGSEDDRVPDIRRCERIGWIGYVLSQAANKAQILCWENLRRTSRGVSKHTVLYFSDQRYVVVLRSKSDCYQIVTSYCVEHESRHRKLIKESHECIDPRS